MIYEQIVSEYNNLETQIQHLKEQLSSLPDGSLCCANNGKHCKWYCYTKKYGNTYIARENRHLAEQLAQKKYLQLRLWELSQEKEALNLYLTHHSDSLKSELLLQNPHFHSLITPHFTPPSQELSEWMYTPYQKNPNYPEQLLFKSVSGNLVRSKSESVIDTLLYLNKIPFRYECALTLGSTTLFPDFTIRHPNQGTLFYWEHFGLMDNSSYSQNAFHKLQLYTVHGIIPSIQLITTYETKDCPLSIDTVEKIITHYFS